MHSKTFPISCTGIPDAAFYTETFIFKVVDQVEVDAISAIIKATDITIYPELSLKNLVITQIYQVLFNLSPAIEVSFWKGMKFTAQMVIPVYNDGYASRYDKLHPGFLELSQTVRLPYNFWATLAFSFNRYCSTLAFNSTL